MKSEFDFYNVIRFGFIPDVVNDRFKYIIEIDGSIHEKKFIQRRDQIKDRCFKRNGYKVYRLEPYNYEQFGVLCDLIAELRKEFCKLT